jgi:hypothetical protein
MRTSCGGESTDPYVAVYVVLVAGVVIVWLAVPPSDQLTNGYPTFPAVCGETTPSMRSIPTTLVMLAGVAMG